MINYEDIVFPEMSREELSKITTEDLMSYVRSALKEPRSMTNLAAVCNIYDYAVSCGFATAELADTCADVLRIIHMDYEPLVDEKLHDQLCMVPDTYHDFIWGVENCIKYAPITQTRLSGFIESRPKATTFDIICYTSFLTADPNSPEKLVESAIDEMRKATMDEDGYMQLLRIAKLASFKNREWILSDVIIDNVGYTLRISHDAVFADCMNQCIGAAYTKATGGNLATILFNETVDNEKYAAIRSQMLSHLERIAKFHGNTDILAICPEKSSDFYLSAGYMRSRGQVQKPDGKLYLKKDLSN